MANNSYQNILKLSLTNILIFLPFFFIGLFNIKNFTFQNDSLFSNLNTVNASDIEGFKAVGMTAMSGLKAKTNYHLKHILLNKDLSDIASWTIKFVESNPKLQNAFFQYYKFKNSEEMNCSNIEFIESPSEPSLTKTVEDLFMKLASNGTQQLEPNLVLDSLKLSEAETISLLCYGIISLHKHFYYSNSTNNFGKDITIDIKNNKRYKIFEGTLFDAWEKNIVQFKIQLSPSQWNQGWTHVVNIGNSFQEDTKHFSKNKNETFQEWAYKTATSSCNLIEKINKNLSDSKLIMSSTFEQEWSNKIQTDILTAGSRIAIVLNFLYSNKPPIALRAGVGLRPLDFEHEQKIASDKFPQWIKNFLINLGICLVVLVILIYTLSFYSSSPTTHSPINTTNTKFQDKELQDKFS